MQHVPVCMDEGYVPTAYDGEPAGTAQAATVRGGIKNQPRVFRISTTWAENKKAKSRHAQPGRCRTKIAADAKGKARLERGAEVEASIPMSLEVLRPETPHRRETELKIEGQSFDAANDWPVLDEGFVSSVK